MNLVINISNCILNALDRARAFDFLGPLALRLYLAPIFILAGWSKLSALADTAYYFGESLGLPAPMLLAWLAGMAELCGGIGLLLGFAVRLWAIPLMITMVVAATTAHWQQGWHVLPETQLMVPWEWRSDLIDEAVSRRDAARALLQAHGDYNWLTAAGNITVLKNGIEFAATYFVMLLVLLFVGAGRYVSLDYWLARRFRAAG